MSFAATVFPKWGRLPTPVSPSNSLDSKDYDCIVVVSSGVEEVKQVSSPIFLALKKLSEVDAALDKNGGIVPVDLPAGKAIYSPVGPLDRDYDDVRRFGDAAEKGVKRAITAGSKRPLLVVLPSAKFPNATLVSVLGAFQGLYVPLQYREAVPEKATKVDELGIYGQDSAQTNKLISLACALESGRFICRDIGGGDPERMAPPRVAEYVKEAFKGTPIKVEVISDRNVFEKEYPLFAAVDRAAQVVERHRGQIIFLTYEGEGPITKTIMPVGKGITYDTGGADIKAGGIMAGMSRDKCGAAAVAGLFQVLANLRPKGLKAIGALAVARNSVGEDCYVSDEVITSRAGLRCRIGNTDAEGRMVMADVLCKIKELAQNEINPHLMTIATLTGHAVLAVGNYTAVLDNGPANKENFARAIQGTGYDFGDMIEVSTLRREDYDLIRSTADGEDLLQCNNLPSSRTPRGHQFPGAFLIESSGLDKYGSTSSKPLKYSHFDIAGSSGDFPKAPNGTPIIALASYFFGGNLTTSK